MAAIDRAVPYGRRLLPITIDEIAQKTPKNLFGCIPKTSDLNDGFIDVTFGDFARAVDRSAWWLEELLEKSTTFETLAYLGPSDLRYFILIIAASKVGYKLFLPSPRNSLEGQVNLFNMTSCDVLITTPGNNIQKYLDAYPMRLVHVPELETLLAPSEVPHYPFPKTFEEAKEDPFLVLHTSGSTGLPKPVYLAQSWFCAPDNVQALQSIDGYRPSLASFINQRVFCCLPPFHAANLLGSLMITVLYNSVSIWAPSNRPMSAPLVEEMLDAIQIDIIFAAPSILEDLSQSSRGLEQISKLKAAHFAGGPLSRHAGNKLSTRVPVKNTMGSTEIAAMPWYQVADQDWEYFQANPALKGIELRPRGEGLYELIFVRHASTDPYHATWGTFPEMTEFSMNDLFSKHPTKPNHWLYVGRADDIIVLSNGEKLSPVAMEASLRDHPGVKGVLVVGQGKFSTAAIVELRPEVAVKLKSTEDEARLVNELWPYAVAANEKAAGHAQLAKDKILIAPASKPFLRAGKGTVQRGMTVNFFEKEIEKLYQQTDEGALLEVPELDLSQEGTTLEEQLREVVQTATGFLPQTPNEDFFAAGMDSLQVMKLSKYLKSALHGSHFLEDDISTRIIYTNPTLSSLARALKAIKNGTNGITNGVSSDEKRERRMREVLQRFLDDLPTQGKKSASPPQEGLTILLTGTTGSLGSYLLDSLLNSSQITKIYCLNRKADAEQRQCKTNEARGLVSTWGTRVEFLKAELNKPKLGLSKKLYASLLEETSIIVHNQWQVDFNLSLPSFTPHITGVANLIRLSSASPNNPPIFFTSSIGTTLRWPSKHPQQTVPEIALSDPSLVEHQGYSESKWVAERLLDAARSKSGVSSAILRVGQIAGPVERGNKGVWNSWEWLPSIVSSSKFIGAIPESLGPMHTVSWTPVDILSKILLELVLRNGDAGEPWTRYWHLDNPESCRWSELVPVIQDHFSSSESFSGTINGGKKAMKLEVVSLEEWVEKLEHSGKQRDVDATKNPGLKLLEFYRDLSRTRVNGAKLDTTETCKESETMKRLKAVDGDWVRLWLEQWEF